MAGFTQLRTGEAAGFTDARNATVIDKAMPHEVISGSVRPRVAAMPAKTHPIWNAAG